MITLINPTNVTQKQQDSILTTQRLTSIFTGICSACAIAILMFIWDLRSQVPVLQEKQETVEKKVDDVRKSMDALADRFTILSTEQVRQGAQLNNFQKPK